jgi:nucleotide-binding universal stress UspA family protein
LAERALPVARDLADLLGAHLTLLWVVPAGETAPGVAEDGAGGAEDYLRDLAQRIETPPAEAIVAAGDPAAAILAEAGRRGADLIAMSTHGRSGLGRWIYGSVADAVMRQASVPILLVSATCPARGWPRDRVARILVPLDYSALSEAVLASARELARTTRAELILLTVTPLQMAIDPMGGPYLADVVGQDQEDRQRYVEAVATKLRAAGIAVKTRVKLGFPEGTILDVAREEDVALIAMSTHGSGGVTRLLMGSVATGVVQRACAPVLIVRPPEVRAETTPLAEGSLA